jgi:hypothetical protein
VFQCVDFSSTNDLKFTYVRLQIQKFLPGVIAPDPHYKGRGRERRGRKGRGGKGGMGWGEPPEYKSWLRPYTQYTIYTSDTIGQHHKTGNLKQVMQKLEVTNFRNFCLKNSGISGLGEKTEFPELQSLH